jgi:phosphonate dehydrogenase
MARPFVYYTHPAPEEGGALLRATCEVRTYSGLGSPDAETIAREARDADALCFFVPDYVDAALIERLPRLRILAGFGKGYDNVDVAAATARAIWVTNVPDALTDGTADLAWALLLGLARRVAEGDAFVRSGRFTGWSATAPLGTAVSGKVLGVVGFGAVGRAIAKRAEGFAMRVLPCDLDSGSSLDDVLRSSDFIVLAVPLSEATYHLIDARRLSLLRPTAMLINVARGSTVDEGAILAALERRTLAGYAADVFELEDRQVPDRPITIASRLLALRNCTLFTPHAGTATRDDRIRLAVVQAQSVLDVLEGRRPQTAVNDPDGPRATT